MEGARVGEAPADYERLAFTLTLLLALGFPGRGHRRTSADRGTSTPFAAILKQSRIPHDGHWNRKPTMDGSPPWYRTPSIATPIPPAMIMPHVGHRNAR
jgi:hypothetical protein